MGIINITPDSFYAGSRFTNESEIMQQVETMMRADVDMIDIGGQSTRPGAQQVSMEEELKRVIDIVKSLHRHFSHLIISIDTFYSAVAAQAVAAGASMINDTSGGYFDPGMLGLVAKLNVPYICMHRKGAPYVMQQKPEYKNVTREVLDYFIERIESCKNAGIHDVIIDPGFGFGKNAHHNFELLKNLALFKIIERPLLIGVSRKSTIYKTLGTSAEEALNGTTVLNTIALLNGASILRTHDVKEAKEAIRLVEMLDD
jgi:dihydropteroate synthase